MTKSLAIAAIVILGFFCLTVEAQRRNQFQDIELYYNVFKDWVNKHNLKYGIEELVFRFGNWKENLDFVKDINEQDLPFKLELNEFASMTAEEFSALHLGFNSDQAAKNRQDAGQGKTKGLKALRDTLAPNATANASYDHLPASVDWRNKGAVGPVENQSLCGSCWAFSAVGALEGLNAIKSGKLSIFSKQQLVDCAGSYGNLGCNGGLMDAAFNYTRDLGVQLETEYPYTGGANATCAYDAQKAKFKNNAFEYVTSNNSLALKAAVARQPVSVAIEAKSKTLQLFKEGVLTTGCGTELDHGVLIVGYDTSIDGTEFWIAKNSWSYKWGLAGYIHIAMGSQNDGAGTCGINIFPLHPTL